MSVTPRQRMENAWNVQPTDRVPFVPAVYEQKAFLIDDTPSNVSRNADLLYRAIMTEHEVYQADALVIGTDVYNIEAEALGANVQFYEGDDTSIPGIGPGGHAITFGDDLGGLKIPNPASDGRMPMMLDVARRLAKMHDTVPVRGALSGPFSLALNIAGPEDVFLGTMLDADYCKALFRFAADVIIEFGKAYLDAGVWTILFDSQASPELFPPDMYEEMVLPETQRIIRALNEAGDPYCPLIIGGNTSLIIDSYLKTGSKQILCDFSADWAAYRSACEREKISVRRNIGPGPIQNGTPADLEAEAKRYLAEAEGMNGFVMGTAVVPFGSPAENIAAIREACHAHVPA
jgi:uroporphyrinogen decarboxylase